MIYLLIALGVGTLSSLPLFLGGKKMLGVAFATGLTLVAWWIEYSSASGYAGPMFGTTLFAVAFFSTIAAVLAFMGYHDTGAMQTLRVVALPLCAWVVMLMIGLLSSDMMNASAYRALVGEMETRAWTQDVQPKAPDHVGLVQDENALYLAKKVVGRLGTIGSQFSIHDASLTLQVIKGELWYVVPLDFADWRAWNNAGTSVGYIMVHAEDPNREPVVKDLPKEKQFVYTPGAYFSHDLIRHLRLAGGNLRVGLDGTHLEIDDEGEAHWITAVTVPTIGQYGDKVQGVLITNPVTGESKFAAIGDVPAWVDRVIPQDFVKDYLSYWGEYVHDWMNSWYGKLDLTEPENPSIVYTSAHEAAFVTGITSQNAKDDSLVGMVYTNTRTGKSVFYEVKGGATDKAVRGAVEKFQEVQFKHLHAGTNPRLYNHYGVMASIVPLLNENHAYQGVAIANISNVQQVAVGQSLPEAIRQFQRLLGRTGDTASVDNTRKLATIEGLITRVKQDVTPSGTMYYIVVEGLRHALTGGTGEFPLLPLAQAGDRVKISYVNSGESVVPMRFFENVSLPLDKTDGEVAADVRRGESRDANDMNPVRRDVEAHLKSASPEELKRIQEAIKEKK